MLNAGVMFDGIVVGFLVLQTFLGWRRGFLWQVAGVASIAFGVLLGLFLTPLIAPFLQAHVTSNGFHARLIAFFFVLGGTGFLLRMAASVAEVKSESNLPKQERDLRRADDRILGGVFGALKGSVLALLLVAAAVTFFPRLRLWHESALAQPLSVAGSRLLPENVMRDAARWASRSAEDVRTGLDIQP